MSIYWLLKDYGCEGWAIRGKYDCLLDAVEAREASLNDPAPSVIVEHIDVLEAYRRADYERDKRNREQGTNR